MNEGDTPYKRAVHMIIHKIIHLDNEYVFEGRFGRFVRWGKVEKDLWALEELIQQTTRGLIRSKTPDAILIAVRICPYCKQKTFNNPCGHCNKKYQ